ncbi:glycosyltransferase family 8 protein [Helicobacter pylori]|nr:glycosyltransferase family 8 protein [Helicobacter pylori]
MQEIVPIVVAFDNNYCIPASKRQTRESKTLL